MVRSTRIAASRKGGCHDPAGLAFLAVIANRSGSNRRYNGAGNDEIPTKLAFGAGAAAPSHDLSKPGVLEGHLEDVNGDGFTDLVSHYSISDSGILPGDTAACLTGKTLGGASFNACDSIRVITGR